MPNGPLKSTASCVLWGPSAPVTMGTWEEDTHADQEAHKEAS